jgi:hypothetical protein
MNLAMLTAAAASGENFPNNLIGQLASAGLLGLIILDLCITRRLVVPSWALKREQEERARERAEHQATIDRQAAIITKMTDNQMTEVVPALTRATDVARQYVETLQAQAAKRHE